MSYSRVNYESIDDKGGLYFLRDALDCEALGISVFDVADGRDAFEHDHAEEGQEEVYLLLDGEAEMTVEDESFAMHPGDAVRVDPAATRAVDLVGESQMVVVGAP